tara:strand:+ start:747 stop:1217 length:471 start_codon:yes stop_codon:yes gene_type:complete
MANQNPRNITQNYLAGSAGQLGMRTGPRTSNMNDGSPITNPAGNNQPYTNAALASSDNAVKAGMTRAGQATQAINSTTLKITENNRRTAEQIKYANDYMALILTSTAPDVQGLALNSMGKTVEKANLLNASRGNPELGTVTNDADTYYNVDTQLYI